MSDPEAPVLTSRAPVAESGARGSGARGRRLPAPGSAARSAAERRRCV